jgi:omega-hydroxy-beta-dihydromenaquinone-9 sulfotransferase
MSAVKRLIEMPVGGASQRPDSSEPDGVAKPQAHRSSQGLYCIWHGLTFSNWLKLLAKRPPMSWRRAPRIASITFQAALNSALAAVEEFRFGRRIKSTQIVQPPVFILGHWRSGTTLLHNLLSLDPQFATPTTFQCLFPSHFLTSETMGKALTGWLVPKHRPMDEMPAGWDVPQEDELALLLLTQLSPYMMLAFQGQRDKYGRFFELSDMTPEEQIAWKAALLYLVRKLTFKTGKAICLKSPTHTYRVQPLLELFPHAKFIAIRRNPYDVYNSSMHLRRAIFAENGLGELNTVDLEEDAVVTYHHCVETFERTKSLIPAGQLHELRYEDLEVDPLGEMERVYRALHIDGWPQLAAAIQEQLPTLINYRKNRFPKDEAQLRKIYQSCRRIFQLQGYPSGLADATACPTEPAGHS